MNTESFADSGRKAAWPVMVAVALLIFWLGVLRHVDLPGLYMDAVNPDYLAAKVLNPALDNPRWVLPYKGFPILGSVYHGVQNFYVGLPFFAVLGTNIVAVRLAQAVFGAAIVALLFGVVLRATGRKWLALAAALGLATDIAFLASFRTQNYIILGGEAWFFASLLLLYPRLGRDAPSLRALFLSGVCFSLATYGYFVFLFFLPGLALIVMQSGAGNLRRAVPYWVAGAAVGMTPYIAGYTSMMVALGGPMKLVESLQNATQSLAPLSSRFTFGESMTHVFDMAKLALTNGGNEMMILGKQGAAAGWRQVWMGTLAVTAVGAVVALCLPRRQARRAAKLNRLIVLLPVAYGLVGLGLGSRLWAHHYSVLIPIAYLLVALAAHGLLQEARKTPAWRRAATAVVVVLSLVIVTANVMQQQRFFGSLVSTGGVGKASDALTLLAEEAVRAGPGVVYLFPDWGFFMSFALLTGNRVPYQLTASPEILLALRERYQEVRIACWTKADADKYEQMLQADGLQQTAQEPQRQRDGAVAFYLVSGFAR